MSPDRWWRGAGWVHDRRTRLAAPGRGGAASMTANLASLLMDHPFADDEDLLHTLERSVTAGDARAEARAVAAGIAAAGVAPGQAVALQLPNSTGAVTAMVGIWLAGCVFVP